MAKNRRQDDTFACPHCGAEFRAGAKACRNCGSDAETGWSAEAWQEVSGYAEPDADDDDEEYREFLAREFPDETAASPGSLSWTMKLMIVLLVLAMLALVVPW